MRVRNKGKEGIDRIATSDFPGKHFVTPKKSPYLIFRFPYQTTSDYEYYTKLEKNGFAMLGEPPIQKENYLYLTITNERKVVEVIRQFLLMPEYKLKANNKLIESLKQFSRRCAQQDSRKKAKRIPPKSKAFSDYQAVDHPAFTASRSKTYFVHKKGSPHKQYVFKTNITGRPISEYEAFHGFCYQLLLGNRHPKVRSVHDILGNRIGVISELLENFQSLHDYDESHGSLSKDDIVKTEMIKLWVAAYVEEEADLHADNYGFDHSGFSVKIDDARSGWPLTSKYALIDPDKADAKATFKTSPATAFAVTERDIASFPFLKDAKLYYWCDKANTRKYFAKHALRQAAKEEKFNDDKYYLFLKRILIPDEIYLAIARATISHPKQRAAFAAHKIKKTNELEKVLLSTPGFQDYVMKHPESIKQILDEFADYNKEFENAKNESLQVQRKPALKKYHHIRRAVFLKNGIDVDAASDMTRDALIGGFVGVTVVGIVAAVCLTAGMVIPIGLSIGAIVAVSCLVVSLFSIIATGVGLLVKRHNMNESTEEQNLSESASVIFNALGISKPIIISDCVIAGPSSPDETLFVSSGVGASLHAQPRMKQKAFHPGYSGPQ